MTQEALRMALEALITASGHLNNEAFVKVMMARDAVVEALAQEQEPVAWKHPDKNMVFWEDTKEVDEYHGFKPTIPLYPHPQRTWVGLTDEEAKKIQTIMTYGNWSFQKIIQTIEAKLKEKNTFCKAKAK